MKSQIAAKAVKQRVDESSADTVLQYLAGDQCDASVRQYIDAALADNTLRAYRADLQHFIAWGGVIPATPEQVASYLAQHATSLAYTTLSRRLDCDCAGAHCTRSALADEFDDCSRHPERGATITLLYRAASRAIAEVACAEDGSWFARDYADCAIRHYC
jgi:hypothetical protein